MTNNFLSSGVNNAVQNRWGGRVDYNLGEKDEIHGFFSTGADNVSNYSTIFLAPIATYGANIAPNYLTLIRLGEDHTFSPSLLLHLGAGFNRDTQNSVPPYNNDLVTYGISGGLPTTPQMYFAPGSAPIIYPSTNGNIPALMETAGTPGQSTPTWRTDFSPGPRASSNSSSALNSTRMV